jgi:TIR domain
MTDSDLKFWAFLSYSPHDNGGRHPGAPAAGNPGWGNWLHHALKNFPIPAEFIGQINSRGEIIPQQIGPVFQDVHELDEESDLSAEARAALEQSRYLVVVCSPRSAQSRRVNEAVRLFKQRGRGRHILPIVVAGEPHAGEGGKPGGAAENECLVLALRHPLRVDGSVDTTRRAGKFIFVDARHGVDKREISLRPDLDTEVDLEMAKIQLIAEVIGVAFNGLWAREQKRHFVDLAKAQRQVTEALQQVEAARRELQAAQQQNREAQNKILEAQNLPRDVHGQIHAAQTQAQAAEDQARAAQQQLEKFQSQVRDTEIQLETARQRALAMEGKFLEAQNQAREMQRLAEDSRRQLLEAQEQNRAAQEKIPLGQDLPADFQIQIQEAQTKVQAAETAARAAQRQLQEFQSQVRPAQNQVQEIKRPPQPSRRLTQVLAVIAVLALMAAGTAAGIAWSQRKIANQALAKVAAAAVWEPDLTKTKMDAEQIRQALQTITGMEQPQIRPMSLDRLAAWIPKAEIAETLKASVIILDDAQRVGFQKSLLLRLGWENPEAAMTCASIIGGKIVNDQGADDACIYLQLAVLGNWMKTDLPGAFNWVCQLPAAGSRDRALAKIIPAMVVANAPDTLARLKDLSPAPAENIYTLFFQCWATMDPVTAMLEWQRVSDQQSGWKF